jgi:chromosomal replication initiator protein
MNINDRIIMENVINVVSKRYYLKPGDICIRTRRRSIAFPRQVAWSLIRDVLGISVTLSDIANTFGNFNYATIHHGIDQVNNIRHTDKCFALWYEETLKELKQTAESWNN